MASSVQRIRRGPRIFISLILLAAVGAAFTAAVMPQLRGLDTERETLARQRAAVGYLRPLTRLLGEIATARSAQSQGAAVNQAALETAVNAVNDVSATLPEASRWTDLRAVVNSRDRFGDALVACVDLIRHAANAAGLTVGVQLDGLLLAEAASVQLPALLAVETDPVDRPGDESEQDNAVALMVARIQLARSADALDSGVRDALVAGPGTPDPGLVEALDAVRAAVERAAGPTALRPADPLDGDLAVVGQQVRAAAIALDIAVLAELDRLLAARESDVEERRLRTIAVAAAGALLAAALLWLAIPPRREAGDVEPTDPVMPDVASVSVQLPSVDARDLLASEELVHVGRGVRARPKDEVDDAD